jgi:hypothetical protein
MNTEAEGRLAWRLFQLASMLGVSIGFLRNEIRRGALVARKCNRAVIVLESDLQAYLDQRRVQVPAQMPPEGESDER